MDKVELSSTLSIFEIGNANKWLMKSHFVGVFLISNKDMIIEKLTALFVRPSKLNEFKENYFSKNG